jgi:hypothetical protein
MRTKSLPDADYIRTALLYDPATGLFRWRERPAEHFPDQRSHHIYNTRHAGKVAGYINPGGYVLIRLRDQGGMFHAHRLAWLLTHGEPIPEEIDHADGNPGNNRADNLRAASRGKNAANTRVRRDSTTGFKGVTFCKQTGKYRVLVTHNGKTYRPPRFNTLEEAVDARREAANRLHGKFARHD